MSTATHREMMLSSEQLEQWRTDGFVIMSGLFGEDEMDALRDLFQKIADRGEAVPNHWQPSSSAEGENILKRYPRFMHPHRVLEQAKAKLLDRRVHDVLVQLIGEEPVACQSMYYFKPPSAKGQALHQDNFYLDVEPQTCIAAWTAIDAVHPKNGGLYVVPGTHDMETQCPELANASESFTTHLVDAPKGFKAIPTHMQSGDVLFFNGQLIHGSGPNRSKDEWRRSFICHYMPRSSRCVNKNYFPILDFDGNEQTYEASLAGGPCGEEWAGRKPSSYQD